MPGPAAEFSQIRGEQQQRYVPNLDAIDFQEKKQAWQAANAKASKDFQLLVTRTWTEDDIAYAAARFSPTVFIRALSVSWRAAATPLFASGSRPF